MAKLKIRLKQMLEMDVAGLPAMIHHVMNLLRFFIGSAGSLLKVSAFSEPRP